MVKTYPIFLIAAEIKDDKIIPGTVRPLRYKHLALNGLSCSTDEIQSKDYKNAAAIYSYYKTDGFGQVCIIDSKGEKIVSYATGVSGAKKIVYMLSKQVVDAGIYLTPDDSVTSWKEKIAKLLNDELKFDEKSLLNTYQFSAKDISGEALSELTIEEQSLWKSYFFSEKKCIGLTIPILKHLVILCSNNSEYLLSHISTPLQKLQVKNLTSRVLKFNLLNDGVTNGNGVQKQSDINSFVISLPSEQLPSGIYSILIKDPNGKLSFVDPATGSPSSEYSLSFKADFNMDTPIGPMDIVNGMPVTLEETMLMHYPAEYAHLTSALMSSEKFDGGGNDEPFSKAKNTLAQSVAIAKVLKEKHDFIKDRIEYDTKAAFDDAIDAIGKECTEITTSYQLYKNYIKCKNNIKKVFDVWKINTKLFDVVDTADKLSTVRKMYYCALGSKIYDSYGDDVLKHILSSDVVSKKYALKILSSKNENAKFDFLFKTNGPCNKILDAQKSTYAKTLIGLDLAFSAYDTVGAFSSLWKASVSSKEEHQKYNRIIQEIAALKLTSPSREATATVIKGRIGVDKLSQGVDQAQVEAIWSAFNLLCSIGALTPAAPVINAVRFVIGTGTALKLAYVNTANILEETFPNTLLTRMWHQSKIKAPLTADMKTNFKMLTDTTTGNTITDPDAREMYVQSRIYAETIRSLMSLIQQVSCRLYKRTDPKTVVNPTTKASADQIDYTEFDEKIDEYKIESFVKRFILKSGWLFPQKMSLPIGLDTVWTYMRWEDKANTYSAACNATLGEQQSDALYYGITPTNSSGTVANHWKADFKKHFPIHGMLSSSIASFAHIFSRNYTGAYKFIRWTQIYYRDLPADGNQLTVNDGWKPVAEVADKSDALTTQTQLRIVIVFDGGVDLRAVPMSLKLYRVETLKDIPGPEYKFIPSSLSTKDGSLIAGEESFEGKLGIVFFPFYMFGGETRYGIRPLEDNASVLGAITQALWKGTVDTPNPYAYTLKIGDSCVPLFFGKTFIDYAKENDLYIKTYKINPVKEFIPALGKHTFLFRLDKNRAIDANMLRSAAYLNTNDSSGEKTPSLIAHDAQKGISGIYFHNEQTGEYFPMGSWKSENGHPRMIDNNETVTIPASCCKPDSIRVTVVLYISGVNDVEFVRTAGFIHSWTATPCSLGIGEQSFLSNPFKSPIKQAVPGTLHFLGYGTTVKTEGKNGFLFRKIRSSVNSKDVTVDMDKNTLDLIEETPTFNEDLKVLLQWGNQSNNFERQLFADPGLFWESAFFAADFDLFWEKSGKTHKGFHSDFKTGDKLSFQIKIAGYDKPIKVDRAVKV